MGLLRHWRDHALGAPLLCSGGSPYELGQSASVPDRPYA
jgi:hypothetical protein